MDLSAMLAKLPAAPEQEQVLQVQAAMQTMLQQVHAIPAEDGSASQQQAMRQVAKAHGPMVVACLKALAPRIVPALAPESAALICELACSALDGLDRLRGALKPKGLELEAQRYNFVRRMLVVGQHQWALQQGWVLHAHLTKHMDATDTPSKDLVDMLLACSLNLIICVSEAVSGMTAARARKNLEAVRTLTAQLVQTLRDAKTDVKVHAESLFRCVFKLQQQCAHFAAGSDLQNHLFSVFCEVAHMAQQGHKLPQYVNKLMSEGAPQAGLDLLNVVLSSCSQRALDLTLIQCTEEAVKTLLEQSVDAADILRQRGWEAATDVHPIVSALQATIMLQARALEHLPACLDTTVEAIHCIIDQLNEHMLDSQSIIIHQYIMKGLRKCVADAAADAMLDISSCSALARGMHACAALATAMLQGTDEAAKAHVHTAITAAALACKLVGSAALAGGPFEPEEQRVLGSSVHIIEQLVPLEDAAPDLDWVSAHLAAASQELPSSSYQAGPGLCLSLLAKIGVHVLQGGAEADALVVTERRCRAHVNGLLQQGLAVEAARVVADYVLLLLQFSDGRIKPLLPLVKLHVRARLAAYGACKADIALEASTSQPAVPAGRRTKRMQAMQPKPAATASVAAPEAVPSTLTEALAQAWLGGHAAVGEQLDLLAYEEVAAVQDEAACSGADADTPGGIVWTTIHAICGVLGKVFSRSQHPGLFGRALLARHLMEPDKASCAQPQLQEAAATLYKCIQMQAAGGDGQAACSTYVAAALAHSMLGLASARVAAMASKQQQPDSAGPRHNHHSAAHQDDSLTPSDAAPVATSEAWGEAMAHLARASQLWQAFADDLDRDQSQLSIIQPSLCLQLLLQLWQLGSLQDDAPLMAAAAHASKLVYAKSGIKLSKSLAMAWAMVRPCIGCGAWASEPRPDVTLVEEAHAAGRLTDQSQAVMQQLQQARDCNTGQYIGALHEAAVAAASVDVPDQYSHIWLLQRTQLHHLASCAYLQAAQVEQAHIHAQEALRLSSAVYTSLIRGGEASSASGQQAMFIWQSSAHLLCALLQAAEVLEAAGLAEDAAYLLRECITLATALCCPAIGALACSRQALVSCRQRRLDVATKQLTSAESLLSQAVARTRPSSCTAFVQSSVLGCMAEVAVASGRTTDAVQHAAAAIELCTPWMPSSSAFSWRSRTMLSRLSTLQASLANSSGDYNGATQHLSRAADAILQPNAGRRKSGSGEADCRWPTQLAQILLVRAQLTGSGVPNSSIRSNSRQPQLAGAIASRGVSELQDQFNRAMHIGDDDCGPRSTQAPARGAKAVGAKSKGRSTGGKGTASTAAKGAAEEPTSTGRAADECWPLMQALLLSWQMPTIAAQACTQLLQVAWSEGLVYAASMALHLRLGYQAAQQQLVLMAAVNQAPWTAPIVSDAAHQRSAARCAKQLAVLLQHARQAVQQAYDGGACGCLALWNSLAAAWLDEMLQDLPDNCAVASISGHTAASSSSGTESSGLMISRLAKGRPPLLVDLPAPAKDSLPAWSREPADPACVSSVATLVGLLAQLLEDSAQSMHGMDTDTPAAKQKWWQARLSLDEQMGELLAHMEEGWLGPWHTLLLPVRQPLHAALQQPSEAVVAEHMGPLTHGDTVVTVAELLQVLMAHMGCMQPAQQQLAVQQLCHMVQQRADHGHVAGIRQTLMEAAAAVAQAYNHTSAPAHTAVMVDGAGSSRPQALHNNAAEVARSMPAASSIHEAQSGAGLHTSSASAGGAAATSRKRGTRLKAMTGSDVPATEPEPAAAPARAARAKRGATAAVASTDMQPPPPPAAEKATATARARSAKAAAAAALQTQECDTGGSGSDQPETSASKPAASGITAQGSGGIVILVLEAELHALPWECMPSLQLQHTEVYRMPSLLTTAAQLQVQRHVNPERPAAPAATAPRVSTGKGGRGGKPAASTSVAVQAIAAGHAEGGGADKTAAATVDLAQTYYLLNPGGDLLETQKCFEEWFSQELGWEGAAGDRPPVPELLEALQSHSLFVYFGHGSGEQYLPASSLRKLRCCAANLLMGCSSGRLRQHGEYGPTGAVLDYLAAGCPVVVANLWDVTDRDIDRFSQALIKMWLGQQHEPAMGASTSSRSSSSSLEDSRGVEGDASSICGALRMSRMACKLPHLIGAAPVCYGLPARVVWPGRNGGS